MGIEGLGVQRPELAVLAVLWMGAASQSPEENPAQPFALKSPHLQCIVQCREYPDQTIVIAVEKIDCMQCLADRRLDIAATDDQDDVLDLEETLDPQEGFCSGEVEAAGECKVEDEEADGRVSPARIVEELSDLSLDLDHSPKKEERLEFDDSGLCPNFAQESTLTWTGVEIDRQL